MSSSPGPDRRRALLVALTLALAALSVGVWASLPVSPSEPARSPVELELVRSRARARDLKRQLDEATARLRERPPDGGAERARAEDLKRRLDEASARLAQPPVTATDPAEQTRAEDLAAQLHQAEEQLRQPRPPDTDPVLEARAADLRAQVGELSARLAQPRAEPEPPVVATMTRDGIVAARGLLGLYTAQAPANFAEVDLVESEIGRQADIIGFFQSWGEDFRADAVRAAWRRGRIPLVTWESRSGMDSPLDGDAAYGLPAVLAGRHDDYLHRWARDVRLTGLPLVLRFDHEMNAQWYPWSEVDGRTGEAVNGNRRGDFVRAWRYVHDVFAAEGANDLVVWLWAPNRVDRIPKQPPPGEFYPGDAYVDWVGMSGYHREYGEEPSFEETFGLTLDQLRVAAPTKPVLLAEIGATEIGGEKAAFVRDLFRGLAAHPDVIGFVWFNLAVTTGTNRPVTNDWRIDSTPAVTDAMREELARAGMGTPLVAAGPGVAGPAAR